MVNKIVEILSKFLAGLAKVLGPILNFVLKPLWEYTDRVWYRRGYENEDHSVQSSDEK